MGEHRVQGPQLEEGRLPHQGHQHHHSDQERVCLGHQIESITQLTARRGPLKSFDSTLGYPGEGPPLGSRPGPCRAQEAVRAAARTQPLPAGRVVETRTKGKRMELIHDFRHWLSGYSADDLDALCRLANVGLRIRNVTDIIHSRPESAGYQKVVNGPTIACGTPGTDHNSINKSWKTSIDQLLWRSLPVTSDHPRASEATEYLRKLGEPCLVRPGDTLRLDEVDRHDVDAALADAANGWPTAVVESWEGGG